MPQPRFRSVVAVGLATQLLVAACQAGSRASAPPSDPTDAPPVATATAVPMRSASASPASTDGCGGAKLSIDYLPYTTATLAGYGWDFVVADVVGFEPAIFNTPDGRRPPEFP